MTDSDLDFKQVFNDAAANYLATSAMVGGFTFSKRQLYTAGVYAASKQVYNMFLMNRVKQQVGDSQVLGQFAAEIVMITLTQWALMKYVLKTPVSWMVLLMEVLSSEAYSLLLDKYVK